MTETVKTAIQLKHKIAIKYLNSELRITVDPYIFGDDLFQQKFIWGWVDHHGTCFKFYEDKIQEVTLLGDSFEVQKGIEYYYSMEEEHYEFVEGIDHYVTFKSK